MADFHFLRPLWLLLLLTLPVLYLALKRKSFSDSGWSGLIPEPFLSPVIRRYGGAAEKHGSLFVPAISAIVILAIALAGPAWREAPTPLKKPGDSLVIALDLSLSMLATDLEPDRLTRAKRKIRDILAIREGSLTGLVVYSGDAHVVTPLTDDSNTLIGMLNVLDPIIMPVQGNRADLAVTRARALLEQGAPGQGRILLITDGVTENYRASISNSLTGTGFTLSTLAAGTRDGGPIPLAQRGFIRDNGNIVITQTDPDMLAALARNNGGTSHELTLDGSDIAALNLSPVKSDEWQDTDTGLTIDRWKDDGYWLLWLALPLLLLGWRRGAFTAMALILMPAIPQPAAAMDWGSLWQREDQRAAELISKDPDGASQLLQSPEWLGSALYRAERFDEGAKAFSGADTALADYNRGNALARAGKLQEALKAYDSALDRNPDMEDARVNRQLVADLLKQQEEEKSSQDQGNSDQQQENNSDSSGDNQNSQGSQSSESSQNLDGEPEQSQGSPQEQEQSGGQEASGEQQPGDASENSDTNAQAAGAEPGGKEAQAPAPVSETPLTQSQEQSLRRVPDNPGGLLQRKFLQQYQERQTPSDEGDTPW
ncbi:Ca-activated chloride channel family protein [Marinobacter antarcticus]|uniref:Ca-activated chloride channel family protein n=1 Tax=Marinobacter antarcticus TaxID=564117 RepID=A0A1M6S411_9GAMM|nr:VWA domain-containing protein [Marinobacter antarcticus]SHK39421.1 Ca-activated chloride channel family protein [Marinobacter antarcticus]